MESTLTHEVFGQVRVLLAEGNRLFLGKDVALACGFKDSAKAIRKRVDRSGRCLCRVTFDGQARSVTFLNLVGLKQFLDAVNTARARDIAAWLLNDDNLQQSLFDEPPKDNLPQIFDHEQFGQVRVLNIDGEPFFVGADIARALGYSNSRDALAAHVPDKFKLVSRIATAGGVQNMTVINEAGVYKLIMRSHLPKAEEFSDWICSEVLPSIRKQGGARSAHTNSLQPVTVQGVRGYVDDKGTVHLNAEDVARGLGFVDEQEKFSATSGRKIYDVVRWARVNEYLAEFDCPPVGKGGYIPENIFYLLAMKANNETAKAFQWKVANDILPSIRKQGFYVADDAPAHVRANLSLKSKEVALLKNQLPAEKMIDFAVVYMLLMSNGSVKIGMTANLTERARQIKAESGLGVLDYVSTPFIAREDAVRLEESLKQRFADKCLGGEFFAIRFYDSRCLLNSPTSLTPAELARAF